MDGWMIYMDERGVELGWNNLNSNSISISLFLFIRRILLHCTFPVPLTTPLPCLPSTSLPHPLSLLRRHNPVPTRHGRDAFLIGVDIARELLDGAALADPQAGAHGLQHRHVVADHQHAALEVAQGEREGVHGFDVEVVGRFVQHEDVWVGQGEAGERHAGLLAAG